MRRNSCILTAVVLAACCSGASMAQSAVGNAGFESEMFGQAPPAVGNWASFFGGPPVLDASISTTAPHTGLSALHLQAMGNSNTFVGVQQPITGVQPGVSYTMKIWARAAGNINNAVEYRFEWKNAAGAFIGDQFALTTRIDATLTTSYQQFTLTSVAPAGTAGANLVLDIQTFTFNPLNPMFDTEVFIDDVQFGATPLQTQGACCFSDGTCQVALLGSCPAGGSALAAGTTCSPNNCPAPIPSGACCNTTTGACAFTLSTTCTALGGSFVGSNSTCSPNPCHATPVCRADFNGNGLLEVQDIFAFLAAWFAGCP